ncbi:hypothetical protein CLV59_104196 [Chitinophaga dinghuensis]|uniref:Uncharacterized protein n=1 Tax=Chitinophaga dinghuensis TaxID=1539050 RepID=A0A327VY50_9BACT|nr:hypothetical protein CLV59_104196 [Chitinophaga dinghuensis]
MKNAKLLLAISFVISLVAVTMASAARHMHFLYLQDITDPPFRCCLTVYSLTTFNNGQFATATLATTIKCDPCTTITVLFKDL